MRVLVTGSKGFIGRSMVPYLRSRQIEIVEYDGDVLDLHFRRFPADAVIHLAAKHSSASRPVTDFEVYKTNVLGTQAAFNFAQSNQALFLGASSAAVYGANSQGHALKENMAPAPTSTYGISKVLSERVVLDSHNSAVSGFMFRIFNAYGPNQDAGFLLPYVFKQILHGQELALRTPMNIRDFVDVRDICEVFYRALFLARPSGVEVMNLGTGIGTRVADIAPIVERVLNRKAKIATMPTTESAREVSIADTTKLEALFKIRPQITLDQGILFWKDLITPSLRHDDAVS